VQETDPKIIKTKSMKKTIIALVLVSMIWSTNYAQENTGDQGTTSSKDSLSFSLNADIVSRYLWRGLLLSGNPNIQPYASLSYKGLTFGAWGSYGLSTPYAEADLYLSLNVGSFNFTVSDYYVHSDDSLENFSYFKYKRSETCHSFEGQITYYGPESFPISLTAATFFAGIDDNNDDADVKDQDYSTYFEVAYTATVSDIPIKMFVGGTPWKGLYAKDANIVNVGINAIKTLKFNKDVEIPVFTTLAVNPASEDIFFVVGITF